MDFSLNHDKRFNYNPTIYYEVVPVSRNISTVVLTRCELRDPPKVRKGHEKGRLRWPAHKSPKRSPVQLIPWISTPRTTTSRTIAVFPRVCLSTLIPTRWQERALRLVEVFGTPLDWQIWEARRHFGGSVQVR